MKRFDIWLCVCNGRREAVRERMLNIVMITGHRHHGKAAGSCETRDALELVTVKGSNARGEKGAHRSSGCFDHRGVCLKSMLLRHHGWLY